MGSTWGPPHIYIYIYMIASGHVYIFFWPFGCVLLHPPPSIFSCLYLQGAKHPSFILIRAALELRSHEKSVRAHRLKIGPKFQTPPGEQISASFQKNQVLQKDRFGLVRGRESVKIECNGTVLKLFAPPSRIFDSKMAYEGQNGPNRGPKGAKNRYI